MPPLARDVKFGRDPASYTDPSGFVYWQDGQVYRRVYSDHANFFHRLLSEPGFLSLLERGLLVPTRLVEQDEEGLCLAHETVWPLSYPHEWSASMLRDALRVTLEVAGGLAETGYELVDGHPWNILFHRGRPLFIDVGSIATSHPSLLWGAYAQFCRFGLYPLHLYAAGAPELARARLQDLTLGVTPDLALRSMPLQYKLRHPVATAKIQANALAARFTSKGPGTASAALPKAPEPGLLRQVRQSFFAGIRRELGAIALGKSGSHWATYYAQCPSMGAQESAAKQAFVERLLANLRPKTVIDLGTNTGHYALMAARQGARVVALDQDEASIEALYRALQHEPLDITPLVMHLGSPSPANGWCAAQRPDALSRFRSDLAMMLAVIHHLVFSGNHSLDQVATLIDRVSERHALVEWVAFEDPMAVHLRRTTTKDFSFYTLENFLRAVEAHGFEVEVQDPHAETRQFLVLTRR